MAIKVVRMTRVMCDSCGTHRDEITADQMSARLAASRAGWKYAAWDVKGKGFNKRRPAEGRYPGDDRWQVDTVPRHWDCCPDCDLPDGPLQAKQLREQRYEQDSHGRWHFRGIPGDTGT